MLLIPYYYQNRKTAKKITVNLKEPLQTEVVFLCGITK
jgi:hypothetical protein